MTFQHEHPTSEELNLRQVTGLAHLMLRGIGEGRLSAERNDVPL
jgi:hypothetical protein